MDSDFSFMRTGQAEGDIQREATITDDMARTMSACLEVLVDTALEVCDVYVVHSGRRNITPEDLLYSLKYNAGQFSDREDLEDLVSKKMNGEEEDDDTDDELEERIEVESEERFCRSTCTCKVCAGVNAAVDGWDSWQPDNPIDAALKRSVESTWERFRSEVFMDDA